MRADVIIRKRLEKGMRHVHAARRDALFRAVQSLLRGGRLWLSALGRSRPSATSDKHSIKAIDRLLGNRALQRELGSIYAAMASVLLKDCKSPVVLVDESEIRPGVYAVTASLAWHGRAIPIYHIVRGKAFATTRRCRRRFLKALRQALPERTQPILVTDAGFESPWFDEVQRMGWDYVGRVRHLTRFFDGTHWCSAQQLHQRATHRERSLGKLLFPRQRPKARRLVLSKGRTSKGRKRKNKLGKSGRTANDRRYQKGAREPWLLATSLSARPQRVVRLYALRAQIEQNYRDTKNHRWGWGLDQTRTRTLQRIEVLLLVASLAYLVQHSVGVAGERNQLHLRFQANTERKRRVLSCFVLGRFLLQPEHARLLHPSHLRAALDYIRLYISRLAGHAC